MDIRRYILCRMD